MTHELIDRIVRQANPVPDMTMLESAPASVLELDRRTEVQTQIETDPETNRPRRNVLLAIAAIVAVVIGGLLLLRPLTNQPVVNQPDVATTTASVETSAPPVTVASDAAPPEMEGVWNIDLGAGVTDRLVVRGTSYSFVGTGVGGSISVDGDQIEFSNSPFCTFAGLYRWSVEGDTLTFTALEPLDQCSERRGLLSQSGPYTR